MVVIFVVLWNLQNVSKFLISLDLYNNTVWQRRNDNTHFYRGTNFGLERWLAQVLKVWKLGWELWAPAFW